MQVIAHGYKEKRYIRVKVRKEVVNSEFNPDPIRMDLLRMSIPHFPKGTFVPDQNEAVIGEFSGMSLILLPENRASDRPMAISSIAS
jgi:hypothetical protein